MAIKWQGGKVVGPSINGHRLEARVHFGLHYRDGRARVSFSSPTACDGPELRAFAAWITDLAAAADAASLGERAS